MVSTDAELEALLSNFQWFTHDAVLAQEDEELAQLVKDEKLEHSLNTQPAAAAAATSSEPEPTVSRSTEQHVSVQPHADAPQCKRKHDCDSNDSSDESLPGIPQGSKAARISPRETEQMPSGVLAPNEAPNSPRESDGELAAIAASKCTSKSDDELDATDCDPIVSLLYPSSPSQATVLATPPFWLKRNNSKLVRSRRYLEDIMVSL